MVTKKAGRKKVSVRRVSPSSRASKTKIQKSSSTHTLEVYPPTRAISIVALLVNFLIPGFGTIVGGKTNVGMWQMGILCIGLIVWVFKIGIVFYGVAWLWAFISSIHILQEARD